MKKLLAALVVIVLLGAGGAGWYVWLRPHDRLALARSLMSKGDARAAQLELRGVLLADPANAEAHFRLGEVQLHLGDPIAAEKELTEARRRGWDAKAVEAPLAAAVEAQGRSAEVLASFHPDGLAPDKAATVLVARSGAALALHQVQAAADAAAQAERLAPTEIAPTLASAEVATVRQDNEAAKAALDRALSIDPHSLAALMMQANQRARAGDIKGELASLDAAVAAAPDAAQPRYQRAQILLQQGRDADARADVAVLLKQAPRSPTANYLQADLLLRARDFKGADAALDRIGPALDQLPRGEMLKALVKAGVNQPEQATEAATFYLGRNPDDPAGYQLVGSLALQAHRPTDAADVLNRAVAGGHANAAIYDLLGQAEAQLGHADAAVAAMQQAAALAPMDRGILTRLAGMQLGRGDPTAAAGDLQHLLDMQPAAPAATPIATTSTAAPAAAAAPAGAPAGTPTPAQTAIALVLTSLQAGETAQAAAALKRLRGLGGVTPAQLDTLDGLLKTAQLDLPGAQRAYESALASPGLTPAQTASSQVNLAGVLSLEGKPDQAEPLLRRALAADPGNVAALAALERLLLADGRADAAVAALEAGHAAAPGNAALSVALADLYDRTKQAPKAVGLLDAQIKALPAPAADAPPAAPAQQTAFVLQAARARSQLVAGHPAEAEATLRALLAIRPRDVGLRSQLIRLLLADHDWTGAQALADEGLAAQPGDASLLSASVGAVLQGGGLQAALDRADTLARDPANLPAARALRGDTYLAAKKFPEAAAAFEAELKAGDATPNLVLGAAAAEQAAGHPDRGAGLMRDYLALHPDASNVASALAVTEIGARHLEAARGALQEVLAREPNNPAALNNMAWVEAQLHQPTAAKAMAQRSWLLSSTPQAADTLGWILLGAGVEAAEPGQGAVALDLMRQAAAGLPGDPSVQYHYAVALKANGQDHAAAAILQKLATLPAFDEQASARALLATLPHS